MVFLGVFDVCYYNRCRVFPVLTQTGAEDGVQALVERIVEGVKMQKRLRVVKRDLTSFIIQVDPDLGGLGRQHQGESGRGQSFDLSVFQPQAPVPALGTQLDLAFATGRGAGHAQGPGGLPAQVHLPVVAARAETLPAQDEQGGAEALGALWVGCLMLFKLHLAAVIRHHQVLLGCGWVQEDFT